MSADVQALAAKLEMVERQVLSYRRDVAAANARVAQECATSAALRVQLEDITMELSLVQKDLASKTSDLESTRKSYAALRDTADTHEANARLQAMVTELRNDALVARSNHQGALADLAEWRQRSKSLEQQVVDLKNKISEDAAARRVCDLQFEDLDRLRGDLAVLKGQLNDATRELSEEQSVGRMLYAENRDMMQRLSRVEADAKGAVDWAAAQRDAAQQAHTVAIEAYEREVVLREYAEQTMLLQQWIVSRVFGQAFAVLQWSNLQSARRQNSALSRANLDPASANMLTDPAPLAAARTSSAGSARARISAVTVRAVSALRPTSASKLTAVPEAAAQADAGNYRFSEQPKAAPPTQAPTDEEDVSNFITNDDGDDGLDEFDAVSHPVAPSTEKRDTAQPFPRSIRPSSAAATAQQRPTSASFRKWDSALYGYAQEKPNPPDNLHIRYETRGLLGFVISTDFRSVRQFYTNQCALHNVKPMPALLSALPDVDDLHDGSTTAADDSCSAFRVLSLSCHGTKMCRSSLRALIDVLRVCPRVQKLDLVGSAVSDSSLAYLTLTVQDILQQPAADGFVSCALKEIVLDGTLVSNVESLVALAAVLPTLTTVSVNRCHLLRDSTRKALDVALLHNAAQGASVSPSPSSLQHARHAVRPSDAAAPVSALSVHVGRLRRPLTAQAAGRSVET